MKDQLIDIPKVLDVRVPLRSRIFTLIVLLSVGLISLYMITELPKYGMLLGKDMLGIKAKFLQIRISKQILSYPLYALAAVSLGYFTYVVAYIKMLQFKANELNFIYKHGVLTTIEDSMNMVDIRDHQERTTLIEKILKLSTIVISANDVSHKELIVKGIDKKDAHEMMIFINNYAFRNYVEFRVKKDMRDQAKKSHKKDIDNISSGDEGDDIGE